MRNKKIAILAGFSWLIYLNLGLPAGVVLSIKNNGSLGKEKKQGVRTDLTSDQFDHKLQTSAKRNLTEDQWQISIGRRYNREKKKVNNNAGVNQYTKEDSDQIEHQPKTSEKLADDYKVAPRTVKNYAKKADEINKYINEKDSRQKEGLKKGKKMPRRSESEQRKPIEKVAIITGKSTDTLSKINQIYEPF